MLKVFTICISHIPNIALFLDNTLCLFEHKYQGVVGWGHKPTADKARCYALKHNIPISRLKTASCAPLISDARGRSLFPL